MLQLRRVLLFLSIVSLFLFITNLVVYEVLASIFSLTDSLQLWALGTSLAVLSGSFIVATIIGTRYYNWFTRLYYVVAATWIGFFVYLFLASILYGLLILIPGLPMDPIGKALLASALLIGIYGVFHARTIRITEVAITLPQLPAPWHGKKAIWMSDLHLGQLHGPDFARAVVEKANTISYDIVFIGGDLFDGTGAPDADDLIAPLKELKAPLGVYFVTGNHEEYGGTATFLAALSALGIRILQDEAVDVGGVHIIGVDYLTASDTERFRGILAALVDPTKTSILLKHEPKDLDVAQAAGIALQISGHTHRAQLWPLVYITQLVYKGFAYGLNTFNGMPVYTSSGTGTWGPPLRVGTDCELVVFTFNA